jgi:hypothetical protein
LLLWGAFFAPMLWLAVTASIADLMAYRGDAAMRQRATELFPWHRTIRQRADDGTQ